MPGSRRGQGPGPRRRVRPGDRAAGGGAQPGGAGGWPGGVAARRRDGGLPTASAPGRWVRHRRARPLVSPLSRTGCRRPLHPVRVARFARTLVGDPVRRAPGRRGPRTRFGAARDLCQDSPVAPAGCRGAAHLTTESRLPTEFGGLACGRTDPRRPDQLDEPVGRHQQRSRIRGLVLRRSQCDTPDRGGRRRPVRWRSRAAGPHPGPGRETKARGTGSRRYETIRTRETYGGTEDPHQAQGL